MNKAVKEYLKTSNRILRLKVEVRESDKKIEELKRRIEQLEKDRRAIEKASS